jgi:hypothetical protein
VICAFPGAGAAQSGSETILGHVVDSAGHPITGATVTVTGLLSDRVRHATSDRSGAFRVVFLDAESRYFVLVRMVGYVPVARIVVRLTARGPVSADAVMAASAVQLEPLIARSLPLPSLRSRTVIGGAEQRTGPSEAMVIDPSDLFRIASRVPGVFAGSDGFTVLGAASSENSLAIDGIRSGAVSLPPDAVGDAAVSVTTADPSRGGFSGSELSVTTRKGGEENVSTLRVAANIPDLSWRDPASLNGTPSITIASGFASGPIVRGSSHYFGAFSTTLFHPNVPSLDNLTPAAAAQLGLAADTITAFHHTLTSLGVPMSGYGASSPLSVNGSFLGTIDFAPGSADEGAISVIGNATRLYPGAGPLATSTVARRLDRLSFRVLGTWSMYLGAWSDNVTGVVEHQSSGASVAANGPTGIVQAGTVQTDGTSGIAALTFGGASPNATLRTTQWTARNVLRSPVARHGLEFGQEIDIDRLTQGSAPSSATYFYPSLNALSANEPASYLRNSPAAGSSLTSFAASVWATDRWRTTRRLGIEGGLRFDLQEMQPSLNLDDHVLADFGEASDHWPNPVTISPRLGFAWLLHDLSQASVVSVSQRTGRTVMLDITDPATQTSGLRGNIGPGVSLFGSIGAYRNRVSTSGFFSVAQQTGSASAARLLRCVGAATPIPEWSTPSNALPDACTDGAAPEFASAAPSTTFFGQSWRPPVSWRADLGLTGLTVDRWTLTPTATISIDRDIQDPIDLNLVHSPAFALATESGRIVYAAPSAIDPSSGLIAPGAGRSDNVFGAVTQLASDLHRRAAQFNLAIDPPRWLWDRIPIRLDYSFNAVQLEQRGFTGTTAGDPRSSEWLDGGLPHHQLIVTAGAARVAWATFSIRVEARSGASFTPVVAGDVNGDGISGNDRAFIPDPRSAIDTALSGQITALLGAVPRSVQDCIRRQLGSIAKPASCQGSAQVGLDIQAAIDPPASSRIHVTLLFRNAGSALFRLLGLGSSQLARNSLETSPDPRLLFVNGFDPVTRSFRYQVNPRFGQPDFLDGRPSTLAPFELQVGAEYLLQQPNRRWLLQSLGLYEHGRLVDAARMFDALLAWTRDPIPAVLALRDSLALSADQVAALKKSDSTFIAGADSIFRPIVEMVRLRKASVTDSDIEGPLGRVMSQIESLRERARADANAVLHADQRFRLLRLSTPDDHLRQCIPGRTVKCEP